MSAAITKQKILDSAVKLFNQDGLVNVRLQHIADEAFVSVGNMTYHYRTKELIVQAIWEQLVKKQRDLLAEFRIVPLFEDIERQIQSTFQLQQAYIFFYLDTLEVMRAFPQIRDLHRQHIQWQMQQIETMMRFNVSRGAFLVENTEGGRNHDSVGKGTLQQLAQQYWMTSDMWLNRQAILGNDLNNYAAFRDALWALLRPCMTDMGNMEFRQVNAMIVQNLL